MGKIETEVAAGYQRIKLKVKPGWDLEILERVRSRSPNILLSCDANSAYTLDNLDHLKKFDQFNLLMIEQPLWSNDFLLSRAPAAQTENSHLPWMNLSATHAMPPLPSN